MNSGQLSKVDSSKSNSDTIKQTLPIDTSSNAQTVEILQPEDLNLSDKTTEIYLNTVDYFKSTNEFYVSLSFNKGYSYDSISSIKTNLDSIVFDDGEIRRTAISTELGRKYFNLSLLDQINVFDYSHKKIQEPKLKRIEYFEDLLGDQFIAVFDSEEPQDQFEFYGISGTEEFNEKFQSRNVDKEDLVKELKSEWKINLQFDLRSSAIEITSFGTNIISFAYHTFNNTAVTYIIEQKGDSIKTLLELEDEYYVWELIPTSVIYKGKPILLLWLGLPETDIEWYSPAVFDGTSYQITNNSRILLSTLIPKRKEKESVDSVKCSSDILLATMRKIDSLNIEQIDLFIQTFSESCRNNVEFSEWSNELLYEVLNKDVEGLIRALEQSESIDLRMVLTEIETPVNDKYMPEDLIAKLATLDLNSPIADSVQKALQIAQSKY